MIEVNLKSATSFSSEIACFNNLSARKEDLIVTNPKNTTINKKGNFEGRLEKDFFGNPIKKLKEINSKVIMASSSEIQNNSRARSAKLRIAEKINDN